MTRELPGHVLWIYHLVTEGLPEHELAIRRLIMTDQKFRELCGEIAEARHAQSNLQKGNRKPNPDLEADWQEIIEALTAEILTHIKSHQTGTMIG
jgi:hypothetical protein